MGNPAECGGVGRLGKRPRFGFAHVTLFADAKGMKNGGENIGARLQIGQLDERITLRQYADATNDYAEPVTTWSDLATVWTRVEYLNKGNAENVESGQPTVFQTVAFTIRHRTDVDEKMRVMYGSDEHDILSISTIGRKQFLKIETQVRK